MAQQAGALTVPDPVVGALQPRLLPNGGRKQIKADLQVIEACAQPARFLDFEVTHPHHTRHGGT
eukprot:5392688-Prorocentrum_lima.AAC.1